MADPDVEVRVDPGAREDAGQLGLRAPARLAHRDGPELRMRGEPPVERPQERPSAPFEMLPGVLAVEDDEDDRLSPSARGREPAPRFRQPRDEVVGRRVGRPAGIDEADQIRQRVIAEPARDLHAPPASTRYGM